MKAIEIESWALRVLERIEAKAPVEDSRVEIKSEWPDPVKAARRLAGHANEARGEVILWLIGADEKQALVIGANHQELSTWLPKVQVCFDGEAPAMQLLNISYKGKTVVALIFDTSRVPYVVANPAFGSTAGEGVGFEIPLRDGTRVRTANRSELVLMLTTIGRLPKIEVLHADISLVEIQGKEKVGALQVHVQAYVTPLDSRSITIPFHKCKARITAGGTPVVEEFPVTLNTPRGKAVTFNRRALGGLKAWDALPDAPLDVKDDAIQATHDELIIRGAGKIEIDGTAFPKSEFKWPELLMTVELIEAISDSKIAFIAKLKQPPASYDVIHGEKSGSSHWTILK